MPFFCKYVCIIVDAYSTGKQLAPIIEAHGFPCIHIKSSSKLPARFQHKEDNFLLSITYNDNIEAILEKIKPYVVKFCIPGYESGVELADLLNEKLNIPGNNSQYSIIKRNKYLMNKAVASAGIKTVEHCKSSDLLTLVDWANNINGYPVVAKPLDSANGDGVFFCHNDKDLEEAFLNITSSINQFGTYNKEALLESLNIGTEYIINTVSLQKKHFIVEIWRVTRKKNTTIYEKAEVVRLDDEVWQYLASYTSRILDALHIQYGAATTEVKYTKKLGATLLETSGRLMGNSPLAFLHDLSGLTQLSLLIESYLKPNDFLERFNRSRNSFLSHGLTVVLVSNQEGILSSNIENAFKNLKSLHSYSIDCKAGSNICKTINSLTSPGEIYLLGTEDQLQADYNEIRRIEDTLYKHATQTEVSSFSQVFFYTPAKQKVSLGQEIEQAFD